MNSTKPTRRQFLLWVTVGAAVAGLAACGGGSSNSNADMADAPTDCSSTLLNIVGNHGHMVTVTEAEINAGAEKEYTLSTALSHFHTFTLTPGNFADLLAGKRITVTTSTTTHSHTINIECM
jgi:hypothetical protein